MSQKEITRKISKYFQLNNKINTTSQICGIQLKQYLKATLALNACIRRNKGLKSMICVSSLEAQRIKAN